MRWTTTRECRRLTWPARLLLLGTGVGLLILGALHVHDFLAPIDPLGGDYLVVEGWMGDGGLRQAHAAFVAGSYRKLIVVGAKPYHGEILRGRRSHAEIAAKSFRKLGIADDALLLIGHPEVERNRTYRSALSVRDWFRDHDIERPRFDLVSEATHSARSRLLYRKAFGEGAEIGVIAVQRNTYDPRRWWSNSAGLRSVITELLGWVYVRLLFWP